MPPLEDELRGALQGRAATLTPPADPFPGVERRARSLRRRRAAASVAGTALAVLAVAGAVPLLTPDRTGAPAPGELATSAPSSAPPPAPADALALDPARPWAYRGDPALLRQQPSLQDSWNAGHPGTTSVVPLFGQVWEPSGQPEVVLVARHPDGDRWGVLTGSEAGWRVLHEAPLGARERALVAPLPGDETTRVLVVAAPQVEQLRYLPDRRAAGPTGPALARLADGVGTGPVETASPADDAVQAYAGGELVWTLEVPDAPSGEEGPGTAQAPAPGNVLRWEPRGSIEGRVVLAARRAYAQARGDEGAQVSEKVLFAGDDDAGRRYLVGQFWLAGDTEADTFALVLRADGSVEEPQLKRPLDRDAPVLAMHLPPADAQSRGELVVVPQPGTGQVLYAGDAASEWVPKDTPGLDGVVLLTRSPQAERGEAVDLLRLLDGDGRETVTVQVPDLLCGTSSCS